mmetsp:Transcript_10428/g.22977  ORF Transcript_10428/g.22977 Transcript_10428/m.22977 type:complete len:245 (+) Transcript_10428:456-1190(+)
MMVRTSKAGTPPIASASSSASSCRIFSSMMMTGWASSTAGAPRNSPLQVLQVLVLATLSGLVPVLFLLLPLLTFLLLFCFPEFLLRDEMILCLVLRARLGILVVSLMFVRPPGLSIFMLVSALVSAPAPVPSLLTALGSVSASTSSFSASLVLSRCLPIFPSVSLLLRTRGGLPPGVPGLLNCSLGPGLRLLSKKNSIDFTSPARIPDLPLGRARVLFFLGRRLPATPLTHASTALQVSFAALV